MLIFLIRHGETDWNVAGRLQGRENIPLNEVGLYQASCAAGLLKGLVTVERVFSSPLDRAMDTAKVLSAALCDGTVTVEDGFTERDFGEKSGCKPEGNNIFNVWEGIPGIEPLSDTSTRMLSALNKRAEEASGDMLAVSHGASINAVLRALSGGRVGTGKTMLKNVCLNILEYSGGLFTIKAVNLTAGEYARQVGIKSL